MAKTGKTKKAVAVSTAGKSQPTGQATTESATEKAKKSAPVNFRSFFLKHLSTMLRTLPAKVTGNRAAVAYVRKLEVSAPVLVGALEGEGRADPSLLPFLACIIIAFIDAKDKIPGQKKGKSKIAGALIAMTERMHVLQHDAWGVPCSSKPVLSPANLTRPAIGDFCAGEYREAMRLWREKKDREAGIAGIFYDICSRFSVTFRLSCADPDDSWVREIPRRRCPSCGVMSWPAVRRESGIDEERGFEFECPMCGYSYGRQGEKRKLYGPDGKRLHSTQWTVDRLNRDACQLCGRTENQLAVTGEMLTAHHVTPLSEGGQDVPSNMLVVCTSCHDAIHRKRDMMRKVYEAVRLKNPN